METYLKGRRVDIPEVWLLGRLLGWGMMPKGPDPLAPELAHYGHVNFLVQNAQ